MIHKNVESQANRSMPHSFHLYAANHLYYAVSYYTKDIRLYPLENESDRNLLKYVPTR